MARTRSRPTTTDSGPAGCEVERLFADRRRLEAATGWGPTRTLWQGPAITVDWFTDPADLARYRTGSCAI